CPYLSKYVRLEPRFDLVHERLQRPCATLERLRREFKDQVLYADLLIGTQAGGYGVKITAQQVAAWPGGIRQDLVRDPLDKQRRPHRQHRLTGPAFLFPQLFEVPVALSQNLG